MQTDPKTTEELYAAISRTLAAYQNCIKANNAEGEANWKERLENFNDLLPSGSGFDSGSKLDIDASSPERLVFNTSFHHMDEGGYYDGWTEHSVIITPSLQSGYNLRVTGRNRNDIKEFIREVFSDLIR